MSELRKRIAGGLPGLPPRPHHPARGVARGGAKSYAPIPWFHYWKEKQFVETERGRFCVYRSGASQAGGALIVLLHGGGYSALTWSLMAKELSELTNCQLAAIDLRGHGETKVTSDESDLSGDTLVEDVVDVIKELVPEGDPNGVVLVGHSMGGALAALCAQAGVTGLCGLVVVDVVEGTAMEALAGMQGVLRSRPSKFASVEQAVEWCVRSGQVRNHEAARVSMPGQICDKSGILAASKVTEEDCKSDQQGLGKLGHIKSGNCIQEEEEDGGDMAGPQTTIPPTGHFSWRVNLASSEPYWAGWFQGLSSRFLEVPTAKLLLLAGVDRLDRELTVGQMQGKFQMQVLPAVGHTVHEDSPDRVAEVIATFLVRNKLAMASENFQSTGPFGGVSGTMGPPLPPPF